MQTQSLIKHISTIPDPRIEGKCSHKLVDIIAISICAIICGAEDWNSIEEFGQTKQSWFESFLELPHGIPSHDTFRRLFFMLSPEAFERFFTEWVRDIAGLVQGVIAIDGKTLRRSHDRRLGKKAIHMVSAWSVENQLVLGQVKTEEKSNEITAIPKLLNMLAIKGCIITLDAMGCQRSIAQQIIDQEGDYLMALKGNQEKLSKAVEALFDQADTNGFEGCDFSYHETKEVSRDRTEIRRHWTLSCDETLEEAKKWASLNTLGRVESERTVKGKTTIEHRYYISSIENNAELFGRSVRQHWGVENSLHWQLDVSFREDESRIRKGYSAQNFAVMRHMALNLLKQEKSLKLGVKNKRLRAGWDEEYLKIVLNGT
ncbi:MAG: ISAs1 family transposase [Gammaproteobacteria bacterium]|nr:ISAs1 family transposase [Gammaproteobacteria bacterium]